MTAPNYAATTGTTLYYGDVGGGDPATQLAGIKNFTSLPRNVADEFETTRVDAEVSAGVPDMFKYFEADKIDPGTLGVRLGFEGTQATTVYGLIGVKKEWKILFSDGSKLVFDGFVKEVGAELEDKGELMVPIVIRVSGKPVFTKYVAA